MTDSDDASRGQPSPQPVLNKACTNCQLRKTRCFPAAKKGHPCRYCARAGKSCTVAAPPSRTPLTRKNIDAIEQRCAALAQLIQSLDPDINIEDAVTQLKAGSQAPRLGPRTREHATTSSTPSVDNNEGWHEPAPQAGSGNGELDGMASLPTSTGRGTFLGRSSGSFIYRQARDLAGLNEAASKDATSNQSIKSPELSLSRTHMVFPVAERRLADHFSSRYLVDVYFLCYNISCPILHEPSFRRMLENRTRDKHDTWFALQYQIVLAIGHWIAGGDDGFQMSLYQAARSRLSLECLESGSLSLVQALLLMGNYLQKCDRPNTAYNYVGLAGRMAIGLGLHRNSPEQDSYSKLQLELRRRVFWTLFSLESGFSVTTGRPALIEEAAADLPLPANVDDKDLSFSDLVDRQTAQSPMIAQSQLSIIANRLHRDLIMSRPGARNLSTCMKSIEDSLVEWKIELPAYFHHDDVPDWFRGPRAIVLWKEQNLRMIFWRACKRNVCEYVDPAEAARRATRTALDCIRNVADFCRAQVSLFHQNIAWYATYFIFQGALVVILGQLEALRGTDFLLENAASFEDSLRIGRESLQALATWTPAAQRCATVLETLCKAVAASPSELQSEDQSQVDLDRDQVRTYGSVAQTPGDTATTDFLSQLGIVNDISIPDAFDNSFDMLFQQVQNFDGDWTQNLGDFTFDLVS
ncbi:Fungal specific transcription factor domain-containing protein 3 [Elsinoe fawcettii]|nr:Fungal specific transcription factor domain-containing protein 3 [Elsinoe fawcettii]